MQASRSRCSNSPRARSQQFSIDAVLGVVVARFVAVIRMRRYAEAGTDEN